MPDTALVPLHHVVLPTCDPAPFTVGTFSSIGPISHADYPHRHTFYEVVLVTGGSGVHAIDFTDHPIRPPQLGFISPGQVHQWRGATGLRGRLMLFTDEFLLAHTPRWDAVSERPWLSLSPAEACGFDTLLTLMTEERERREADYLTALRAYLHVFLIRALRVQGGRPPVPVDRVTAVAQGFTRLLTSAPGTDASVRVYAAQLGVSAGHLCEVVKAVTGRTPGQLIREARALEARRLLGGTELTVAQVSRTLGFADPAYFCRFFRRETGTSPGDFRRRNHHVPRIESIDPPDSRE